MHCWIIFERLGAGRDSPIGTGRGEFLLEEGETQGKWEGFQIPFQSFDLKCNPTPAIPLLNFRTPSEQCIERQATFLPCPIDKKKDEACCDE